MLAQIEGSMDFLNLHNSQPDLVTFYIYEWNLLRISFFSLVLFQAQMCSNFLSRNGCTVLYSFSSPALFQKQCFSLRSKTENMLNNSYSMVKYFIFTQNMTKKFICTLKCQILGKTFTL